MKTILAIVTALSLTVALGAGPALAHHGHKNLDKPGHQIKAHGNFAGELSPGHAKHHED